MFRLRRTEVGLDGEVQDMLRQKTGSMCGQLGHEICIDAGPFTVVTNFSGARTLPHSVGG